MSVPLPEPLAGLDTTALAGMIGGALALIVPQIIGRALTHGDRKRAALERAEDRADDRTAEFLAAITATLQRCEAARASAEANAENLRASRDQVSDRYYAARAKCTCKAFLEGPDLRRKGAT